MTTLFKCSCGNYPKVTRDEERGKTTFVISCCKKKTTPESNINEAGRQWQRLTGNIEDVEEKIYPMLKITKIQLRNLMDSGTEIPPADIDPLKLRVRASSHVFSICELRMAELKPRFKEGAQPIATHNSFKNLAEKISEVNSSVDF